MTARLASIAAELGGRGLKVQVLDYRWNAGETIVEAEPHYILRYRLLPTEVSVAARLDGSKLINFGPLMFFPADVSLQTDPAASEQRTRNIECRFEPSWFRSIWPGAINWAPEDLIRAYDMRNIRVAQAMQRLGAEVLNPGFASVLLTEATASVIAVEIARHFGDAPPNHRVRTRNGRLSQSDLNRIYEYVAGVTNHCPSIDDISQQCNISPAHLRRSFKNTVGKTVHQYVDEVRLQKARALLSETDLPLKEVSYRLGFADSSTFSSTFRKAAGETPSGYRHRTRG